MKENNEYIEKLRNSFASEDSEIITTNKEDEQQDEKQYVKEIDRYSDSDSFSFNEEVINDQKEELLDKKKDATIARLMGNMPPVFEMKYAQDIFEDIRKLASDKGKASEFFQPVIDQAKIMIKKGVTEQERAEAFAKLVFNAKYYLDKRGASKFSRQRNRRRATCERLIEKVGIFLSEAPGVYAESLSNTVNENQKTKEHAANATVFKDEYSYFLGNEFIDAKKGEDWIKAYLSSKDPDEVEDEDEKEKIHDVQKIFDLTEGLSSLTNDPMPVHPGVNAKKADLEKYEKDILDGSIAVTRMYDILIQNCDRFIEDHADDELITGIKDIRNHYLHTRKVFQNSITNFIERGVPGGNATWAQAITANCGRMYNIDSDDTQILGSGTSIVYKMTKGGKTVYFKKDEKSATTPVEAWERTVEDIKNMADYDESYDSDIEKVKSIMKEIMDLYRNAKKNGTEDDVDGVEMVMYDTFIRTIMNGDQDDGILQRIMDGTIDPQLAAIVKKFSRINTNTPGGKFAENMVNDFMKRFNTYYFGESGGIKRGKNISDRNVMTSRMATLMGIGHMVMRSETADVMQGGKRITGILMDEAQGTEAENIYNDYMSNAKYTPACVMDMMTMQVFDFICGQFDRNYKNFFLTRDEYNDTIESPLMIDNDMAGGTVTGERLAVGLNNMPILDRAMLAALPKKLTGQIKKMAEYPKEYFKLVFGDILDDDEIAAMQDRIQYLDRNITEAEVGISEAAAKSEDGRFLAECMEDPEVASLYFQMKLWKNGKAAANKLSLSGEQRKKYINNYVEKHSYFAWNCMDSEKVLGDKLKAKKRGWKK